MVTPAVNSKQEYYVTKLSQFQVPKLQRSLHELAVKVNDMINIMQSLVKTSQSQVRSNGIFSSKLRGRQQLT